MELRWQKQQEEAARQIMNSRPRRGELKVTNKFKRFEPQQNAGALFAALK